MNFQSELVLGQRRNNKYLDLDKIEQLNKKNTKNYSLIEQKTEKVKDKILVNEPVLQDNLSFLIALPRNCTMQIFNYSEMNLSTIKQISKTFKKIVEENMPVLWMEKIKKDPLFISFTPINHSLKVNQQWKLLCKNVIKEIQLNLALRTQYPNFFNKKSIDGEKKQILTSHVLKRLVKWCEAVKITIGLYQLKSTVELIKRKEISGYISKLEKKFKKTEHCLESEIKVAEEIKEWLAQNPTLEIKLPLSPTPESNLKQEFSELDRDFFKNILKQNNMSGNIDLFGDSLKDFN